MTTFDEASVLMSLLHSRDGFLITEIFFPALEKTLLPASLQNDWQRKPSCVQEVYF